jgi:polyisoprenoid-binding protein YceI
MSRRRLLMALFALAATAAGALEPDQVIITYDLKMGTRQISGVSHELEWSFRALDEERAEVRLRVPIESFDSGHRAFDSALCKAIGSERHPFAQIEGIARQGRLDGRLDLAGVVRPVTVGLRTERVAGNVVAVASLAIDLGDYGIALEGVDPHASIDVIVRLVSSPDAVLAGGVTRQAN